MDPVMPFLSPTTVETQSHLWPYYTQSKPKEWYLSLTRMENGRKAAETHISTEALLMDRLEFESCKAACAQLVK